MLTLSVLCILVRVPPLITAQLALRADPVAHASGFSPQFTEFARAAAATPHDMRILAAGWGIATQVHCFSQGEALKVREIFWREPTPESLRDAIGDVRRFVLVTPLRLRGVNEARAEDCFRVAASLGFRRCADQTPWAQYTALRAEAWAR